MTYYSPWRAQLTSGLDLMMKQRKARTHVWPSGYAFLGTYTNWFTTPHVESANKDFVNVTGLS